MSASGREVVLGVGAGIAAYKACDVVRRLQDHGFLVTVVPTPSSLNFVGAATWEALSGREVATQVWENIPGVAHVRLAQEADFILIAPATADLISRLAQGRADDLLTNVVLASGAPIMVVPAMHPHMWTNPGTMENVQMLRSRGFTILDPDIGRLTGPDVGVGRFPDTARIIENFEGMVGTTADLLGRKILITAGGTREPIDAVRYIGNRSSGKQGFAIAQAAFARGADVELIAANCPDLEIEGVHITRVETTQEMQTVLEARFDLCDILVMCAAVADAKPAYVHEGKLSKEEYTSISLIKNPDLLAEMSSRRREGQVLVGFAAETQDHLESARAKMERKGVDILYVNDVTGGAIFGSDITSGTILTRSGGKMEVNDAAKDTLADVLLDHVLFQLG
ncbi:MAG: bifunctional phosphopantothenoylcysteine decarboxylase/phosphopantothenate--cysteine ligase CoaBC [Actinobacteria bacterium]|nr:bifunctional phosphopantothenoylcysteine decarboxylase/phosphopantothenate--cysteine ligase CoaBC [Actinomycetota bacterium]